MTVIPDPRPTMRVTPLQRLAQGGKWRTEAMRSYSQPLLLWFTRGQGRITVAGVTRGYGPHNLLFLPAGTMHGYEISGQVFGSAVFLPNDPSLLLPSEPLHMRFRETIQQSELTGLIEVLQRELDRDLPGKDRALTHHAGLLSVWLERQIALMPEYEMNPDASRRLTAAYSALVEKDFAAHRTVADFARDLGVTPTHLSRSCNVACGRPASAILADRLHFEARKLLIETGRPIKEIAADLGFSSPAYFTRAFLKHTGTTPSDFRNRDRAGRPAI